MVDSLEPSVSGIVTSGSPRIDEEKDDAARTIAQAEKFLAETRAHNSLPTNVPSPDLDEQARIDRAKQLQQEALARGDVRAEQFVTQQQSLANETVESAARQASALAGVLPRSTTPGMIHPADRAFSAGMGVMPHETSPIPPGMIASVPTPLEPSPSPEGVSDAPSASVIEPITPNDKEDNVTDSNPAEVISDSTVIPEASISTDEVVQPPLLSQPVRIGDTNFFVERDENGELKRDEHGNLITFIYGKGGQAGGQRIYPDENGKYIAKTDRRTPPSQRAAERRFINDGRFTDEARREGRALLEETKAAANPPEAVVPPVTEPLVKVIEMGVEEKHQELVTKEPEERWKKYLRLLPIPLLLGGGGHLINSHDFSAGEAQSPSYTESVGEYKPSDTYLPDVAIVQPQTGQEMVTPQPLPSVTPEAVIPTQSTTGEDVVQLSSTPEPTIPVIVPSSSAEVQDEGTAPEPIPTAEATPRTEQQVVEELLAIDRVPLHIDKPGDSISQSWKEEQGKSYEEYAAQYYDQYEVTTAGILSNWQELEEAWKTIGGLPVTYEEYMKLVMSVDTDPQKQQELRDLNQRILDQQDLKLPHQIFYDFKDPQGAQKFYTTVKTYYKDHPDSSLITTYYNEFEKKRISGMSGSDIGVPALGAESPQESVAPLSAGTDGTGGPVISEPTADMQQSSTGGDVSDLTGSTHETTAPEFSNTNPVIQTQEASETAPQPLEFATTIPTDNLVNSLNQAGSQAVPLASPQVESVDGTAGPQPGVQSETTDNQPAQGRLARLAQRFRIGGRSR